MISGLPEFRDADLLLRDMTARQVADLTAFLASLKTPAAIKNK